MEDDFLQAFTQVIREQLCDNCEVAWENIGVFSREHKQQYQQQYQNGRVVMMPPEDAIKFVADSPMTDGD